MSNLQRNITQIKYLCKDFESDNSIDGSKMIMLGECIEMFKEEMRQSTKNRMIIEKLDSIPDIGINEIKSFLQKEFVSPKAYQRKLGGYIGYAKKYAGEIRSIVSSIEFLNNSDKNFSEEITDESVQSEKLSREKLKELLAKGKIEKCLKSINVFCTKTEHKNELILICSRLNELKIKQLMGLLDQKDTISSEITLYTLNLIDKIFSDNSTDSYENILKEEIRRIRLALISEVYDKVLKKAIFDARSLFDKNKDNFEAHELLILANNVERYLNNKVEHTTETPKRNKAMKWILTSTGIGLVLIFSQNIMVTLGVIIISVGLVFLEDIDI